MHDKYKVEWATEMWFAGPTLIFPIHLEKMEFFHIVSIPAIMNI